MSMETQSFLKRYRAAFGTMQGMFSFDAALLMMAYAELAADYCTRADTLEIGVHHGLSAVAVASMRGAGRNFVAIDLFEEMQEQNVSHSGLGNKARFLSNMKAVFGDDIGFVNVIAALSSSLSPRELGQTYSVCHVDGGHSCEETYRDLVLCSQILQPCGLLVLDDYFNPNFPGVSEGAVRFKQQEQQAELMPLAVGFNKALFQKKGHHHLNDEFERRFPRVPHTKIELWERPALHFACELSSLFDLDHSTPYTLIPRESVSMAVRLNPQVTSLYGRPGELLFVPIHVENMSDITLCFTDQPIGLSYHMASESGDMIAFDNKREYFGNPLSPGSQRMVDLPVNCPQDTGRYRVEVDLVWEGVCWFKEKGNRAPVLTLTVG
jgi:predicted O-methyltransferase YrrM